MQKAELSDGIAAAADARNKAPVFVLGCPRSGTTLLYHMLLSAGNFAVYRAESQVLNLFEPRFGDLSIVANRSKLLAAWRKTELFRRTGLDGNEIGDEVMAKCRNGGEFLRIVMEAMARRQGVDRWADCTPEHLLYLDRIKRTIPGALVIHIIRDGRDVALSLERQAWIRPFFWDRHKTLEVAALYWDWIVNTGREAGRALGSDYIEVRYEELVLNPGKTLQDVGRFIGQELDYDKIERVGIGSLSRPNSSFSAEMKHGEFSPVGRWKTSLAAVRLERLEALIGGTLSQLGYELCGGMNRTRSVGSLRRMRGLYHYYFAMKLHLKKRTPFARMLASRELPRFEQERSPVES